jgi:hypothetical protein
MVAESWGLHSTAYSWGAKKQGSKKQNGVSFKMFNFRKKTKEKRGLEAKSAGEELAAISNSFLQ